MPLPGISELAGETAPLLDEVTIVSSEESANLPAGSEANKPLTTKRKKRGAAVPQFLQPEEWERLIKSIDSVRDRAIFRLAYHAGLRASEVGGLDMRDYQPRVDRIYIRGLKGSNSGDHHMCREESRALRAWLKVRGSQPGPIFPSKKRGAISRKMLHVLMRKYGAAADIPPALRHMHVLKHSCGTHLMSRGFGVEQVQDWMRHANIQNTLIYAKITNKRRDEMAAALRDTWR
jgi:integrase